MPFFFSQKRKIFSFLILSFFLIPFFVMAQEKASCPLVQVCFTPPRGCLSHILKRLFQAKKSIYIQAYSFTSRPIAQALQEAHKRGVSVQIILDKSQAKDPYSLLHTLSRKKIPIFIDPLPGIAHNKVMILDEEWVITGSYNFTQAAETRNAENLLIIKDREIAQTYLQNWYRRRGHAHPWEHTQERPGIDLSLMVKELMVQLKEWIE